MMRRSTLLTLTTLGALICLLGGSGLFAALTDTAGSGPNSVDSAELARVADIQVGRATVPAVSPPNYICGPLSEELGSGFFTASDITVGYTSPFNVYFCVKNVGSQPVTLTALATDLRDVDDACSGDEAVFDATCGNNDEGELSGVLSITYRNIGSCIDNSGGGSPQTLVLRDNATTPAALGSLAAGQTRCFTVGITYPVATASDAVQGAQSDAVTWRITFTGQS